MKRKRIAWTTNLVNIGVLTSLVLNNCNPVYGMIACSVSALTILIAVIPEALKEGIVYNDDFE